MAALSIGSIFWFAVTVWFVMEYFSKFRAFIGKHQSVERSNKEALNLNTGFIAAELKPAKLKAAKLKAAELEAAELEAAELEAAELEATETEAEYEYEAKKVGQIFSFQQKELNEA